VRARGAVSALSLAAIVACGHERGGAPPASAQPAAASGSASAPPVADVEGSEMRAANSPLVFRLAGKPRVPYSSSTLGPAGYQIAIRARNDGDRPVPVPKVFARTKVTREGVVFPCGQLAGAPTGVREPRELAPGASFVFRREVDCPMPLPGAYSLAVTAQIAEGDAMPAGEIAVLVEGKGPAAHPTVRGLHAAVLGNNAEVARMLRERERGGNPYAVTVALVNGSPATLVVHDARVSFRVTKVGAALPCMDEPVKLPTPITISPGEVLYSRVPITCVMHQPGDYDIASTLAVGADPTEVPMGSVRLTVSNDPNLFAPPRVY
jgi:hypothetical protein